MKELTVSQRIAQMVEVFASGNKSAFAKAVGISNQSLGEIVGGRQNAPSFAALQKMLAAYPEVRVEWLVMGQGEMREGLTQQQSRPVYLEELARRVLEENKGRRKGNSHESNEISGDVMTLIEEESIYRQFLTHLRNKGDDIRSKANLSPSEQKQLFDIEAEVIEFEAIYLSVVYSRMELQQNFMKTAHEARTTIYRVGGKPDPNKLYGGLLSVRLDISEAAAESLVVTGKIRAVFIDGEGYRISEQAVRAFLGEA